MSRQSDNVKAWRKRTKKRIILAMGGSCQICGYNKCESSLSLHHIIPNEKEISFGAIRANPRSWVRIVSELKKCILLCNNCHSEVHAGYSFIPEKYEIFDEKYSEYTIDKFTEYDKCPVCGIDKPVCNRYCSLSCSSKFRTRIDWDNIDLISLLKDFSISGISERLNISYSSVYKRMRKIGLK